VKVGYKKFYSGRDISPENDGTPKSEAWRREGKKKESDSNFRRSPECNPKSKTAYKAPRRRTVSRSAKNSRLGVRFGRRSKLGPGDAEGKIEAQRTRGALQRIVGSQSRVAMNWGDRSE